MVEFREIPLDAIFPSPYQVRKHFAPGSIAELAMSIHRDGLVEPIVVRRMGKGFELIAGQRRWMAAQTIEGYETILSRIVDADDIHARRMLAAENLIREDLSPIETVEAIIEMVDAELIDDETYIELAETSLLRVKTVLMKLDSDYKNQTDYFRHKFVSKVESIFSSLPRPQDWRSFYTHDLPLITTLDPEVKQVAIEQKLNKSQTKELWKLKEEAPDTYTVITEAGHVDPVRDLWEVPTDDEGHVKEPIPLKDVSARDLRTISRRAKILREAERQTVDVVARNWMNTLEEVKEAIKRDVDRLKIIVESINREGGFERLTEQWHRQDILVFCQAMVGFGEMFTTVGNELLQRMGVRE